jgi:hypothetical protein
MDYFKRTTRPVIILVVLFCVLEITLGQPMPNNETVEDLVREANTERDVSVVSVEILENGDGGCEKLWKYRGKCRWSFKVQVVKDFNPGNGEIIKLVHQKTVEILLYRGINAMGYSKYHCLGCDTGLASNVFGNE